MKLIAYAGAKLLTGDDIAAAVLEYCAALADEDAAETLHIPVLREDGTRGSALMLVGPASQIVAEDVDSPFEELIDTDTVDLLASRIRSHRPIVHTSSVAPAAEEYDETWPASI